MHQLTNFTRHLLQEEDLGTDPHQTHALADVLNQIVLASKILSRDINKAGLTDILGESGIVNVQEEKQQKLDDLANRVFIELLRQSPYTLAVGTEESEELHVFADAGHGQYGQFIVYIDPVDGSSNIDVNVSIGTNFAIFRKPEPTTASHHQQSQLQPSDYLQPGKNCVAAGYIVYGSSTMLVYSTGRGVTGFTLDPSIGEFLLSHPQLKFPSENTIYSINESNQPNWDAVLQNYITELKVQKNVPNARYIGSLVADFHRNLLKGGIYLYPADSKQPQGKLRLMYEAIPFAFLAHQAGGYGSNGKQNILDLVPTSIHQRTPFFVGNKEPVKRLENLLIRSNYK